jgi:hypothetical protein
MHTRMIRVLTLGAMLSVATGVAAEVRMESLLADIEVIAASDCPTDPVREPDLGKFYSENLAGFDEVRAVQMTSDCGYATTRGALRLEFEAGEVSGGFAARSLLDQHGGGRASTVFALSFTVDADTPYEIAAIGQQGEFGTAHLGGLAFELRGQSGELLHDIGLTSEFDVSWTGTLLPGIVYTLAAAANSERSSRSLGGGDYLFMDGDTSLAASFVLSFPGSDVVPVRTRSMGRLKSGF